MNKKNIVKKAIIPIGFAILTAMAIPNAYAGTCSPGIAGKIINNTDDVIAADLSDLKKKNDNVKKTTDQINDVFGCTDIWPTGDFGFTIPSITDILKDMGEEAMKKACNLARDEVRKQTDKINQNISLDTSMIDGYDELGLGNHSLGGASSHGGTGGKPGVDFNSRSSGNNINNDWNSISNVVNSFK